MADYICLILDHDCRVRNAEILQAVTDGHANSAAAARARDARAWGYELWHRGRQVGAFYDCKHPPARVGIA